MFTILTANQIAGSNKLEMIKKRGGRSKITDFSILLGGYVNSDRTGDYFFIRDNENRRTTDGYNHAAFNYYESKGRGGIRPVLQYSQIKEVCLNKVKAKDGILEIEYGEYPQQAASKSLQITLENLFKKDTLKKTKKTYTRYDGENDLRIHYISEYEYNGNKYVRIGANLHFNYSDIILSNGEKYSNNDTVWIEVKPIKWLVDENQDIAVTDKIIFAGVQFNKKRNYEGNFCNSNIKNFMDTHLSKDIIPSKTEIKLELPALNLESETRNPIITEINFEHKPGTNITLTLPKNMLESIDTITIQSKEDSNNQVVYMKKR